jgi:hypothetical protein
MRIWSRIFQPIFRGSDGTEGPARAGSRPVPATFELAAKPAPRVGTISGSDGLGSDQKVVFSPFFEPNGATGVATPPRGGAAVSAACV